MRVKFLKDWQGEGSASHKKDEIVTLDVNLAWDLAVMGYVKFIEASGIDKKKAQAFFNERQF